MGSTSDEFYRFQSVQTTGGCCSCEEIPSVVASDQPVDPGTSTRGLSTGGTVGVPVPVMFL